MMLNNTSSYSYSNFVCIIQLNYYYWPWDTQSCELIVGSWTKSGWEVDVVNMNGGKNLFTNLFKKHFKIF